MPFTTNYYVLLLLLLCIIHNGDDDDDDPMFAYVCVYRVRRRDEICVCV